MKDPSNSGKLSPQFRRRLQQLKRGARVRAILLLGALPPQSREDDRGAASAAIRQSASAGLPEVDSILQKFGGRRLSDQPDVLGSVAVETTAPGLEALAEEPGVRAIFEDQPITLTR